MGYLYQNANGEIKEYDTPLKKAADGRTIYPDGTKGWTQWKLVGSSTTTTDKQQNVLSNQSNSTTKTVPFENNNVSVSGGTKSITEGEALAKGWDWNNLPAGYVQARSAGQPQSVDEVFNKLLAELQTQMEENTKKMTEYDTNNPFNFDETLAKASAEEIYNPYYKAELSDFLSGISRQKSSAAGEKDLLMELNRITSGEEKRALDEAISSSEEGYAGAGLFFSGARERATGLEKISGAETTAKREAQFGYNMDENLRKQQGLTTAEATGRRQNEAAKTSTVESSIANQKAEERAAWEYAKAQYISPYQSNNSSLQSLLERANRA